METDQKHGTTLFPIIEACFMGKALFFGGVRKKSATLRPGPGKAVLSRLGLTDGVVPAQRRVHGHLPGQGTWAYLRPREWWWWWGGEAVVQERRC